MTATFPKAHIDGDDGFLHEALLYSGDDGFLAGSVPFIIQAVEAGEPVLAMVSTEKIELLREPLGGHWAEVRFADMEEIGSNPARILPAWKAFVDAECDIGRPVRGIGEPISAGRGPDEIAECLRHEALLNLAFADGPPWRLLCPYDVERLESSVIAEAKRAHPTVRRDGDRYATPDYRDVREIARPFDAKLSEHPAGAHVMAFGERDLASIRRAVGGEAASFGLEAERADDLVLAVDEVVTNSLRHGGGGGILLIWHTADALVCEVRDTGRIGDPLVGRERPGRDQTSGFGVWLANQLCDLVQIRTLPGGSVVRMHMRRH
jgi:anti-sigma regulatory factor (Ser/Thr protein kinase)